LQNYEKLAKKAVFQKNFQVVACSRNLFKCNILRNDEREDGVGEGEKKGRREGGEEQDNGTAKNRRHNSLVMNAS
jgi:hypothetical protein